MNIASVVYGVYPSDSRVRRQAEALVRKGYRVDVIALRSERGKNTYSLKGVNIYQLPLTKKRGGTSRYLLQYCAFFLLSFCWITCLYIKRKYSVVHVNNMPNFIVYSALVPKIFGAKIILDIHDPFPELFAIKASSTGRSSLVLKLLQLEERVSVAFADHLVCTTDLIRDVMVKRGAKLSSTTVVTNAPDTTIFRRLDSGRDTRMPKEKKSFSILYAGTVVERYGVSNIVKALSLLRDDIPGLKFRVIGSGEGLDDLKRLVATRKMEDIVEFLPLRRVEEIPREYESSDAVLWFPERNQFIDIIMCVKVLEAQAMGLPVISTRTDCHAHYFRQKEVSFVDFLGAAALAAAVFDLYENYEARKPTPESVARFVEKFGWETEQEKYFELIKHLACSGCVGNEAGSVEYG